MNGVRELLVTGLPAGTAVARDAARARLEAGGVKLDLDATVETTGDETIIRLR